MQRAADEGRADGHVGERVVVVMLTYRRPDDLREAVPAFLEASAGHHATLLVVDNDPDASAREWVTSYDDPRLRYAHEPRPGIAAARNRALDETVDDDVLVFVDDDERPEPGWLDAMLDYHRSAGAPVVVGAVVADYAHPPEAWMTAAPFFGRRRLRTGTELEAAGTGNLLLDLRVVRPLGVRFDERFGLSGGSDTMFTRTLVAHGLRLVTCDEAVVRERIPADRMTPGWVLRRARRSGNSAARAEHAVASPGAQRALVTVRYSVRGSVRVLGGFARTALGTLRRDPVEQLMGRRTTQRGVGMLAGAAGKVVSEYERV